MPVKMTKELARAAATDAGNASMQKAGRTKWNKDDWYRASREYNRLWPNYLFDAKPSVGSPL